MTSGSTRGTREDRSGPSSGADVAMICAVPTLGFCLAFTGFTFVDRWIDAAAAGSTLGLAEALGAVAAGAGIAITLWWALALACAVLGAIAEHRGRSRLASVLGQWSPGFMRRLVIVVMGMNLISFPLAANAAPHTASGGTGLPGDWSQGTSLVTAPRVQGPQGPVDPVWEPSVMWKPPVPAVDAAPVVPPPARSDPRAGRGSAQTPVIVRPGDSLWTIAAHELGPFATDFDIAQAWPLWYRANRAAIGPDPNVLAVGLSLHFPNH